MTIAAQVIIAFNVYKATLHMREEWPRKVEENSTVLVVSRPEFWGPVHLLVPATCKEVSQWNGVLDETRDEWKKLNSRAADPTMTSVRREQAIGATTTVAASSKDSKTSKDAEKKTSAEDSKKESESGKNETKATERRLAFRPRQLMANPWHPVATGCFNNTPHKVKTFSGPNVMNRYFSMITLSAMVTGGTTTVEKLIQSRVNNQKYLFWLLIFIFFLKYGLKISDIVSFMCSHKYVQLWNGGRTKIDKLLESMMIHGLAVVFTLAIQLTMCTNFLTFWNDEGFFTMSYIPGLGFVIFFVSFVFISVFMVLDRCMQWMVRGTNCYIWTFWCVWTVWMMLVTVPMIGYSIYVVQFVLQIKLGHMLRTEPFTVEFVQASHDVCEGALWLTIIAILELVLVCYLDYEEASTRQRGQ